MKASENNSTATRNTFYPFEREHIDLIAAARFADN